MSVGMGDEGVGRGRGSGRGCRVWVGGGWRAERAVPRRGTIMVSPTQAVPEVPVVWGYDSPTHNSVPEVRDYGRVVPIAFF